MFERFTDRARRVVVLAQEEARRLSHNYIGTEHILLALLHEGEGVAAHVLASFGITLEAVRQQVEEVAGRGSQAPQKGHLPFTRRTKKALELSLREALQLGHNYIGTEHILLGLIREGEDRAAVLLARMGADLETVRQRVVQVLVSHPGAKEPGTPGPLARIKAGGRGKPRKLTELLTRLDAIESRLEALEHRVGSGPDVRDIDQQIAEIRRDKEAAIDAEDFERATELRDSERQLIQDKNARQRAWADAHTHLSLSEEVERLRGLLRQHGIEPPDAA